MWAQSRQMNANNSANGIVTATISAVRTLNRNRMRMTSTSSMPAQQIALDGLGRLLDQLGAVVVRDDLHVRRQHGPVERVRQLLRPSSGRPVPARRRASG